ncbi:MAG TPA: DUF4375 domain-containing protein [Acidimicrobiales bacterium]|nr:DUF4375 domain-containing protein [Acidimicrobiales bacterium]
MAEIDSWARFDEIALAEPATLTEGERRLQAFGWLRTEINNGGFHQLLFNSAGDLRPVALEAAREAGADELVTLVERAIGSLGEPYPTDRTGRQEILERLGDHYEDSLEPLDAAYYELEAASDLDVLMAGLLR